MAIRAAPPPPLWCEPDVGSGGAGVHVEEVAEEVVERFSGPRGEEGGKGAAEGRWRRGEWLAIVRADGGAVEAPRAALGIDGEEADVRLVVCKLAEGGGEGWRSGGEGAALFASVGTVVAGGGGSVCGLLGGDGGCRRR